MRRSQVALSVLAVVGLVCGGARPARAANSVSGSAFGASATTSSGTVVPNPTAVLPPDGGTTEGHVLALDAPGIVSSGTLTANSTGSIGPLSASATSKAAVEQVNILNGLVTADAVIAMASCTGDGALATCTAVGTTILNLTVNSVNLGNVIPPPNTMITVPLVGTVILNEQTTGGDGVTTASLTVNLIHVVLSGILGTGDIIVGQAHADVDFAPVAVDPCACPQPQNGVSGEAYGSEIALDSVAVERNPRSLLSSQGGSATAGAASINVPGTLSSGTVSTSTTGSISPSSASAQSESDVESLDVLSGLVTADVLDAVASCSGDGTTASCSAVGTTFVNLVVNGNPVAANPPANTTIAVPGGVVIVNQQITSGTGTTTAALTVNLVHIMLGGSPAGDVIVASAHADVDFTLPPVTCNPCDDGDPCNGVEICDPQQGCLPGPPPSTACSTTTTTTSTTTTTTTLAQCGNGVLESPEQCDPPLSPTCPAPPGSPPLVCNPDCTCPPPCPPIAFLVRTDGKVGNSGQVTGGIGANDPGGEFGLGKGVFVSDGSTVAGDSVRLGRGASVFHVDANHLRTGSRVVIRDGTGTPLLPLTVPFCPIPSFACSAQAVTVAARQSAGPLAPGSYGSLNVANLGAVVLAPGTFQFCSLKMGRNAALVTTGTTQSTLQIAGDFRVGNGAFLGPAAGTPSPRIEIGGASLRVGAQAVLQAFTDAPNALFRVGRSGQVRGTLCASASRSDKGIVLTCPP
jgi:hypothetical protein